MAKAVGPTLVIAALFVAAGAAHAAPIAGASDPAAIIGGAPVDACAWPSTVFLENCTGTLIHPEIVVYAAHCGDDRERVWFGEDISSGQAPDGAGFSVDTEFCAVNPDYGSAMDIGIARAADFAFCKLATPVTNVPIVPPLMGCETTILTSGTDVTLVGYGTTDQETFGVKFEVDTILHYIDDFGAAVIGGDGESPCAGDSGGPAFVQMPDGTWRAFGIVSGPNVGNCSDAMWFATIYNAVPFIEQESGIDVSACHSGTQWNPSPTCGDFPTEPRDGAGKSWADGCAGGPALEWSSTCGPAFDLAEDLVAPTSTITAPADRERFDTEPDAATVPVTVTADVIDDTSGVATVVLIIDGAPVDGAMRLGAPWRWDLSIPPGVWEIAVLATDWAGNEAQSEPVVIGVDEDPPEKPEPPSTSSGAADESSGSSSEGTTGGGDTSTTSVGETTTGTDTTGEGGGAVADGDGCGCRSTPSDPGAWLVLTPLFALVGVRRRRALSFAVLAGCSSPSGGAQETGTSTSTTEPDPTATATTSTSSDATSTSTSTDESSGTTVGESSTGPACEVGTLRCSCNESFDCNEGLTCMLDTCIPCETGTITCPCHFDEGQRDGECDEGLYCFGGLCAAPQPCPFLRDGQCDEPRGSGKCLIGTDDFDCCATMDDVCEEASQGGACPDGSDPDDCGAATTTGDSGTSGAEDSSESSGGSSGSSSTT